VLLVNEHRKEGPSHTISRRQLPTQVHRRDGRPRPLSVVVSNLLDDDGVVVGYVLGLRDLTQVRALEARARRSEELASLGAMAAAMAHEVRNPLHAIHSATELIEAMAGAGRPIQKYLDAVLDEVAALERLVRDVLNFSKVVDLRLGPIDVAKLARDTVELLRLPDGIVLELEVAAGLPWVEADPERLQQVIRNLVRNAVEVQPEGGVIWLTATLGPRRQLAGDEELEPVPFVVLEVRDEGPGIDAEDVPHLFEPFFTRRTSGEGTGLGLAICRRLVEAHGGFLEVDPRPGEGASFRILLPAPLGPTSIAPRRPEARS
jgi:signal transduction histidine kinase